MVNIFFRLNDTLMLGAFCNAPSIGSCYSFVLLSLQLLLTPSYYNLPSCFLSTCYLSS